MSTLSQYIVRNEDGSVDNEATKIAYDVGLLEACNAKVTTAEEKANKEYAEGMANFEKDLATHLAVRGKWDPLSERHIDAAFDRFAASLTGGTITKPALVNFVTNAMLSAGEINFGQLKEAGEMVTAWIDDNKGALYDVARGPGGGVRRIKR